MELDELTLRVRVLADEADAQLTAFAGRVGEAGKRAATAQEALAAFAGAAVGLGAGALASADGLRAGSEALAEQARQLRASDQAAQALHASVADVEKQTRALQAGLKTGLGLPEANQRAYALLETLYALEGAAQVRGDVSVNTKQAHKGLTEVIAASDSAAGSLDALRQTAGKRGGSGGLVGGLKAELRELDHLIKIGCADAAREVAALAGMLARYGNASTSERYALQERLYAAQERLRQENLQRDLDAIAHKRAMDELTLEQELAQLARVRAAHRMTAEEINALEEQMYQLRQDIRARDASAIDHAADGLTAALQARYQSWKAQELARLTESGEAWQAWADEATAALQAQLDALDALATAESRQAEDEKELRQLESLRQQLAYERDAYNRAMLESSLAQATEARAARLRAREAEDEKQALRAAQQGVAERLQAEQAALRAQQTAVENAYAERLQSQNLAAEAERLLLRQNQEELVALLAGYAPTYSALGQTLGERLAEGFSASLADITAWFDGLGQRVYAAQQQVSAAALAAADGFAASRAAQPEAVTVHQTNTFNLPVESPSDTARKVAQANEDLGLALLGL